MTNILAKIKKIDIENVLRILYFLPVLGLIYVWQYGVNVANWDEYEFSRFFDDSVNFWQYIFTPHNEHFMPIGKIFYYLIACITNMNSKVVMYFDIFILWMPYLLLLNIILKKKNVLLRLALSVLLFFSLYSPISYENLLWGFQISFLSAYAFSLNAIVLSFIYLNDNKSFYLILATLCAVIASLNSAHGFFSWIAIIAVGITKKDKKIFYYLIPFVLIVCYMMLYIKNVSTHIDNIITQNAGVTDKLLVFISKPLAYIEYFFSFIGGGIRIGNTNTIWIGGLILFVVVLLLLLSTKLSINYLSMCLICYGVSIAAVTTYGRVTLGNAHAITSHYWQLCMPVYLGLIFIKFDSTELFYKYKKIFCSVVSVLLCLIISYNSLNFLKYADGIKNQWLEKAVVLYNFHSESDQKISATIYPWATPLRQKASVIEANKLNVFEENSSIMQEVSLQECDKCSNWKIRREPRLNVDKFNFEVTKNYFSLDLLGWAFNENTVGCSPKWRLVIESDNKYYLLEIANWFRPDVSAYYHNKLDYSGFGFNRQVNLLHELRFPLSFYLTEYKHKKLYLFGKVKECNNETECKTK